MLEEFKKALERRKLSKITIQNYIKGLKIVEIFIKKPIEKADKKDLERFIDSISERKPNTIRQRITTLKIFFKWLKKPEIADFPMPKKDGNNLLSSDLLSEDDIEKMVNIADNPRDKALLNVLFDSACRKSEILNLNIEDFVADSDGTGYICVDGKTGKRQVPLSFSIPSLKAWLNNHPFKNKTDSPMFIATKQSFGHRLSDSTLEMIIKGCAKKSKVNKNVFCHLFRHSRLTDLDKKGLSHTAMKYFAGWSKNSNMPSVYSHFSAQDTKELIYEADGITQPKIKKKIIEPINCFKCNTPNDKTNKYCYVCGMPLDEDSQKELEAKKEFLKICFEPDIWKVLQEKIKR